MRLGFRGWGFWNLGLGRVLGTNSHGFELLTYKKTVSQVTAEEAGS